MFTTSSSLVTSALIAIACEPISRAASAAPSALRSASATCAPSLAKSLAAASPMPDAAPVISAALPSNCPIIRSSRLSLGSFVLAPLAALRSKPLGFKRIEARRKFIDGNSTIHVEQLS